MKLRMKKISMIVLFVMVGLLSLTALTAASDIVWPWSSEPGHESQALFDSGALRNRLDEGGTGVGEPSIQGDVGETSSDGEVIAREAQISVTELQPDDNGYTGPIAEANQVDIAPSGGEQTEEVDWDALIPEDAPDQVVSNADPNWSTDFYYYHVTGSALRPRDSSVEWTTGSSGGCLYLSSGTEWVVFNIQLDIPDGVRIDYLRLFYYDTSANDSYSWVTRYNDEDGIEDVAAASSEGTAGYGTFLSPLVEHVVDNANYSYILNWRPYQLGSSMMLCGLRVAYRLP